MKQIHSILLVSIFISGVAYADGSTGKCAPYTSSGKFPLKAIRNIADLHAARLEGLLKVLPACEADIPRTLEACKVMYNRRNSSDAVRNFNGVTQLVTHDCNLVKDAWNGTILENRGSFDAEAEKLAAILDKLSDESGCASELRQNAAALKDRVEKDLKDYSTALDPCFASSADSQ